MSRGLAWVVGSDPVLYHFFAIQNRRSFPIRKKISRNGSGSHVPIKNSRHRPPTALKLVNEDSQLSGAYPLQIWWRSASCEARNHGVKVLCAKSTFFLCCQFNRNDPSLPTALFAGFSTMKGNPVLSSDFGYDNSWPNIFFQRKFYASPIPGQITPPYRMETPFFVLNAARRKAAWLCSRALGARRQPRAIATPHAGHNNCVPV